jgi:hypothetical protein
LRAVEHSAALDVNALDDDGRIQRQLKVTWHHRGLEPFNQFIASLVLGIFLDLNGDFLQFLHEFQLFENLFALPFRTVHQKRLHDQRKSLAVLAVHFGVQVPEERDAQRDFTATGTV